MRVSQACVGGITSVKFPLGSAAVLFTSMFDANLTLWYPELHSQHRPGEGWLVNPEMAARWGLQVCPLGHCLTA